ncbi:MAG: hypothetical protein HYV26_11175 [Candidatus Hydrogenedentes bacterium]|nr:hypothetical protein [Candidatus Hydrogenedentota bacterium]
MAGIVSRRWAVIVLIIALGAVSFIVTVAYGILGGPRAVVRLAAPGEVRVEFAQSGGYAIYHEYPRALESRPGEVPENIEGLRVTLRDAAAAEVPLRPATSPRRYAVLDVIGVILYEAEIPRAGAYQFSAEYPAGTAGPSTHLVIKRSYRQQVREALGRGAIVLASFVVLLGAVLFSFSRRKAQGEEVDDEFVL